MSKEEQWKEGDRVQCTEWAGEKDNQTEVFHTGAIASLVKETRERKEGYGYRTTTVTEEFVSKINVKWDDGTEEELTPWEVYEEDSEIDRDFRKAVSTVMPQIDEKLALASKYLSEAQALAEEHGIPFSSGVSPLSQNYLTRSFPEKWEGVNREVVNTVTDTYDENGYYGWQHSAVCY